MVVIFILCQLFVSLLLPCKSVDVRVCLTTQMFYIIYLGLLRARIIAKFSLRLQTCLGQCLPLQKYAQFLPILYLFYMLFYSYYFCVFLVFFWTILKQFFTYFKPIILKQKIAKKQLQSLDQNLRKLALKQLSNSLKIVNNVNAT